jgi:hypothetical protein
VRPRGLPRLRAQPPEGNPHHVEGPRRIRTVQTR